MTQVTIERELLEQSLAALVIANNIALVGSAYSVSAIETGVRKIREAEEALRAALQAAPAQPVGINGLTQAETEATMSVRGLSEPAPSSIAETQELLDDIGLVAVEALEHAIAGGHLFDLYKLPKRQALHRKLHAKRIAATQPAPSTAGEWDRTIVSLPIPASASDLKSDIAELIQSHKYKGLRSIEVLGVFQFLGAEIISGSNS